MVNFLRNVWNYYLYHLEAVLLPFQPMLDDFDRLDNVRKARYRYHYVFDLFLTLLVCLDTVIQYELHGYDKAEFIHHLTVKFMPPLFKRLGDISYGGVFLTIILCYAVMVLDSGAHAKFILFSLKRGSIDRLVFPYRSSGLRFTDRKLGIQLVDYLNRKRKSIAKFVSMMTFQMHFGNTYSLILFELYTIYMSDWQYFLNHRVFICVLILPPVLRSFVGALEFGIQFMLQNSVINIKQRFYLKSMTIPEKCLKTSAGCQNSYRKCMTLMGKILDVTREIEAFSQFYKHIITGIIILLGGVSCSVSKVTIEKAGEAPFLQSIGWIFYTILSLSFVVLFNNFSSLSIWLNIRMFKKLRQLQIRLISSGSLKHSQIVKLDLVNEYKLLLQKCAFRLSNSGTINNKLFVFQIFGCVSVFYMKLVSDGSF